MNEDQKAAIAKYDEVMQNLEFARELQSSFKNFVTEEDRMKKKQSKKEVGERLKAETSRMASILTFQKCLQALNSKQVKEDFKKGENGAAKLSKEQAEEMDEMIKFFNSFKVSIAASDENDKVNANLADHLINLADAKAKKVANTKLTYKSMNELLTLVKKSGYNFEAVMANGGGQPQVNGVSKKMTNGKSNDHQKPVEPAPKQHQQPHQPQVPQPTAAPAPAPAPAAAPVVPMPVTQAAMFPPPPHMSYVPQPQGSNPSAAATGAPGTTQPSINFLQESQIDMESPHMDPAVVMVHHTAPPPTTSGGPPFNQIFIPPTTLAALQQQHFGGHFQQPQKFQQAPAAPVVPQQDVKNVIPVEKNEPQQQPPPQQKSENLEAPVASQPSKPPGYASIAAGLKENKTEVKDEMPPIDDWNEEIAKEEENSESRDFKGGRGGGRGRGRGGNFRGRGGNFIILRSLVRYLIHVYFAGYRGGRGGGENGGGFRGSRGEGGRGGRGGGGDRGGFRGGKNDGGFKDREFRSNNRGGPREGGHRGRGGGYRGQSNGIKENGH